MSKFGTILKGVLEKEIIIPRLNTYLYDPKFPGFDVPMAGFEKRIPDGWFHPSTHPLWPERLLYWYARDPKRMVTEPLDPIGTQAVTQGNFWHAFFQTIGIADGWLKIMTPKAKTPHDMAEYWVEDPALGTGGSLDGVLEPDALPIQMEEGFEIKTMVNAKLRKCPKAPPMSNEKIEWFRDSCPEYYAQAMEYLRMSGYPRQRILITSVEYPYPKVELCIPFDRGYSAAIVEKYRRVRQAVAEDHLPDPCCGYFDTKVQQMCPARTVCPIALRIAR
jgi:hypothetical protein